MQPYEYKIQPDDYKPEPKPTPPKPMDFMDRRLMAHKQKIQQLKAEQREARKQAKPAERIHFSALNQ